MWFRSPGGTPLKVKKEATDDNKPVSHEGLIFAALKKRFVQMRSSSSEDEDSDSSDTDKENHVAWKSFESPKKNSSHLIKPSQLKSIEVPSNSSVPARVGNDNVLMKLGLKSPLHVTRKRKSSGFVASSTENSPVAPVSGLNIHVLQ